MGGCVVVVAPGESGVCESAPLTDPHIALPRYNTRVFTISVVESHV